MLHLSIAASAGWHPASLLKACLPRVHFLDNQEPFPAEHVRRAASQEAAVMSEAEQYRRLARELHLMARSLPPGEHRSALLKVAEEWDRVADQQKHVSKSASRDGYIHRSKGRRSVS
jgi:hypothetical protein